MRKICYRALYICCKKTFCEIILLVGFWDGDTLLFIAQKLTKIFFFCMMTIKELEPYYLEICFC